MKNVTVGIMSVFIAIFIGILILISVDWVKHERGEKLMSPSGAYYLETKINKNKKDRERYLCVVIVVKHKDGRFIEEIKTDASDRMSWDVNWGVDDSIILDSSDIGGRIWKKIDADHWKEVDYVKNKDALSIN